MTESRSLADRLFGDIVAADASRSSEPVRSDGAAPFHTPQASADEPSVATTDALERELFGDDYSAPDNEMFPVETALRPALAQRHDDEMVILQLPHKERVERHRVYAALIRESGLDPNTVGQALYHLALDQEIAEAHGAPRPADYDENPQQIPPTVIEPLLTRVRAQLGAQRGERLVHEVNAYLAAHKELGALLRYVSSRPGFGEALEAVTEHVRKTRHV